MILQCMYLSFCDVWVWGEWCVCFAGWSQNCASQITCGRCIQQAGCAWCFQAVSCQPWKFFIDHHQILAHPYMQMHLNGSYVLYTTHNCIVYYNTQAVCMLKMFGIMNNKVIRGRERCLCFADGTVLDSVHSAFRRNYCGCNRWGRRVRVPWIGLMVQECVRWRMKV